MEYFFHESLLTTPLCLTLNELSVSYNRYTITGSKPMIKPCESWRNKDLLISTMSYIHFFFMLMVKILVLFVTIIEVLPQFWDYIEYKTNFSIKKFYINVGSHLKKTKALWSDQKITNVHQCFKLCIYYLNSYLLSFL